MLALEDLRRRVAALEQAAVPPVSAAGITTVESTLEAIPLPRVLPELAGAALGLIYAGAWLVASIRIRADRRLSAAFEAITASCIIAPLLWEATVRFHTLSPAESAAALSLFVILGQMIAWRQPWCGMHGIVSKSTSQACRK